MLHATSKSDLMSIIEGLPNDIQVLEGDPKYDTRADSICKCVAVVNGLADLQSLNKPEWISNCSDLANHFIDKHWQRYSKYDNKVHLVLDSYDISESRLHVRED